MPEIQELVEAALGIRLPPPIYEPGLETRVRNAVARSERVVVALDDDPTGVQTVHDVAVLADWDTNQIRDEIDQRGLLFFILTNSRSLPGHQAADLNRVIAANLRAASEQTGIELAIASRSDSTLRGHFPIETDALAGEIGGIDGVLVCPAFIEGGRVTAGDVHFVLEGTRVVPSAETEFARDATFGYRAKTLPDWVAEKTRGRWTADAVACVSLHDVREGGPDRVAAILRDVLGGQPVVINALDYADLWTVALGVIQAESNGKRFLYRTGASFVRARAGIGSRPLLRRDELLGPKPENSAGVVVVGSHVRRTTEQLERLLALPALVGIEVAVTELLADDPAREIEVSRVRVRVNAALANGQTPVVFTSRSVARQPGRDELEVARSISEALVSIVQGIEAPPNFIVGKGGITSSDVGTRGLGVKRAMVLGQIRPGVPVWELGPESRFPQMPYVVFPGNVGGPDALAEVVSELVGPGG